MNTVRPIPQHPGYFASRDGRIFHRSEELRPFKTRGKYLQVTIDGKTEYVHHLILLTFAGARPEGHVAIHADGDMKNNHVDNLLWLPKEDVFSD